MASTINVELVTPEALVFSDEATLVVAPGSEGEFGVLPLHSAMVSELEAGVVKIDIASEKGRTDRIFISSGFAEVTEERCTILVEEAMPVAEIKRDKAEARLLKAREALEKTDNQREIKKLNSEIKIATAMIAAVS